MRGLTNKDRLSVNVRRVRRVTGEVISALQRLIPQLSLSDPPDRRGLAGVLMSPGTVLLAARYPGSRGKIVGTLTLVLYRLPTGLRARIEDLVVDERMRRKGIGKALVRHAVHSAAASGAKSVDLTSHPSRKAANLLYPRLGFVKYRTNVYRYDVSCGKNRGR
ncbi:MAG: GNAT family N-acetyltransferase [Syntrophales bacterium]